LAGAEGTELGSKFRKAKALTLSDLAQVVEWKFKDEPEKKNGFRVSKPKQ